jgi:exodeoxyribonuclease VII large subunit
MKWGERMEKEFLSVSALTKYIKLKFDKDRYLVDVPLKAEIAEINARRGNYYVRLKDDHALISGVIFAQYVTPMVETLEIGSEVVVIGDISVYEKTGAYQIYIHEVELFGQGQLYLAFEQLKKKLLAQGFFELEHKKAIPEMPQKLVLITAPGSAALHDMLITLQKRYPLAEPIILPAAVQGAQAVSELTHQLHVADTIGADVIVLARGGGSYEDLQAFNDERLAQAIFNLKTPLVSGVGHEIDVTIADLVADLRAATPTAAIEHITPDKTELYKLLQTYTYRLRQGMQRYLARDATVLQAQVTRLKLPYIYLKVVRERGQTLAAARNQLNELMVQKITSARSELTAKQTHLAALSPFDVLVRGYSITQQRGHVITQVEQVSASEPIDVVLSDGTLVCKVEEIKNDKEETIV